MSYYNSMMKSLCCIVSVIFMIISYSFAANNTNDDIVPTDDLQSLQELAKKSDNAIIRRQALRTHRHAARFRGCGFHRRPRRRLEDQCQQLCWIRWHSRALPSPDAAASRNWNAKPSPRGTHRDLVVIGGHLGGWRHGLFFIYHSAPNSAFEGRRSCPETKKPLTKERMELF